MQEDKAPFIKYTHTHIYTYYVVCSAKRPHYLFIFVMNFSVHFFLLYVIVSHSVSFRPHSAESVDIFAYIYVHIHWLILNLGTFVESRATNSGLDSAIFLLIRCCHLYLLMNEGGDEEKRQIIIDFHGYSSDLCVKVQTTPTLAPSDSLGTLRQKWLSHCKCAVHTNWDRFHWHCIPLSQRNSYTPSDRLSVAVLSLCALR